MWDDDKEYDEDLLGPAPPWLHLLQPQWRAWRENEILRGRNPDPYIEKQLIERGQWKPEENKS